MTQQPPQEPVPPGPLKHSGPGIASFIVSAGSFVVGIAATTIFSLGDGVFTLGPFCSCGVPTGIAGIILGIIGLALPHRKKLYAYLGLTLGILNIVINGIFVMLHWVH